MIITRFDRERERERVGAVFGPGDFIHSKDYQKKGRKQKTDKRNRKKETENRKIDELNSRLKNCDVWRMLNIPGLQQDHYKLRHILNPVKHLRKSFL